MDSDKPEKVNFYYFNASNGGVVTVALTSMERYVYAGAAYCSPSDQFAKKVGRTKATGRLTSNILRGYKLRPYEGVRATAEDALRETDRSMPRRWIETACHGYIALVPRRKPTAKKPDL